MNVFMSLMKAGGVVLVEVAVVVAPGVGPADEGLRVPPLGLEGGLVELAERAVQLRDDVGGAAADLGQPRRQVRDVQLARDARRRVEGHARVVVGVLPEITAFAVAAVQARRPVGAELARGADQELVDLPRVEVFDEQLSGRGADRLAADEEPVGIEVGIHEGAGQVAVPRGGARQRVGRGVVPRIARVDGVLAVVGPGRADAGLDHLAERNIVHLVFVPGRGNVAAEGRRVLPQSLAVQGVVAGDRAQVEGPVPPLDRVVQLDVLGVVLGVDGGHAPAGLALEACGVEDRRPLEAQPSAGHGDRAPAVRAADEVFGVHVILDSRRAARGGRSSPESGCSRSGRNRGRSRSGRTGWRSP